MFRGYDRKDFANYAETCFQEFGDRVKHWITFNEPHTEAIQGYDLGLQAPGRCSTINHLFCKAGNSSTEPYIFAHNVLLSHATVAGIYRKKYKVIYSLVFLGFRYVKSPLMEDFLSPTQKRQGGEIGLAFDVVWFEPGTNSTDDIEAAQRAQDFQLGW